MSEAAGKGDAFADLSAEAAALNGEGEAAGNAPGAANAPEPEPKKITSAAAIHLLIVAAANFAPVKAMYPVTCATLNAAENADAIADFSGAVGACADKYGLNLGEWAGRLGADSVEGRALVAALGLGAVVYAAVRVDIANARAAAARDVTPDAPAASPGDAPAYSAPMADVVG